MLALIGEPARVWADQMNPKQYLALLDLLEREGFKITRSAHILRSYAELYQWNQWTIQLTAKGLDKVEALEVHTFFDSESLSWRNKVKAYLPEQVTSALIYLRQEITDLKTGQIGLLCEALQD